MKLRKKTKEGLMKLINIAVLVVLLLQPISTPGLLYAIAADDSGQKVVNEKASVEKEVVKEKAEKSSSEDKKSEEKQEKEKTEKKDEKMSSDEQKEQEASSEDEDVVAEDENGDENGDVVTEDEGAIEEGDKKGDDGDVTAEEEDVTDPEGVDEGVVDEGSAKDEDGNADKDVDKSGKDKTVKAVKKDAKFECKEDKWIEKDGAYTRCVEKDKKYSLDFDKNDKFSPLEIKFTKIGDVKIKDNKREITVKEIKLTDKQVEELGALSNIAYDITSTMEDGTFKYDLTLPLPKDTDVHKDDMSVVYVEDEKDLKKLDEKNVVKEATDDEKVEVKIDTEKDKVEVKKVDHFTIWIVKGRTKLKTSAMLNGGSKVVVAPNTSINVNLGVDITQWSLNTWRSTDYRIKGGDWVCLDTADHKFEGTNWRAQHFSEKFNINAPAQVGSYDLEFRVYPDNNCQDGRRSYLKMDNVITVENLFTSHHYDFKLKAYDKGKTGRWAIDYINVALDLTPIENEPYCYSYVREDKGRFETLKGNSPGGKQDALLADIEGSLNGGFEGEICGTLIDNPDLSGEEEEDLLNYTYGSEAFEYAKKYFHRIFVKDTIHGFSQENWGWKYITTCNGTWEETSSNGGGVGDIKGGTWDCKKAPEQTGYNENDENDPNGYSTPRPNNDFGCDGGVTNINGISVHWTDVSGENTANVKYQRQFNKQGAYGWTGSEIYTNPYTNYRTFGGDPGSEATYGSRVRAWMDMNGNDTLEEDVDVVSPWSNECSITYDKTAPTGTIDAIKYPDGTVEPDKFVTNWRTPTIVINATDTSGVKSVVLKVEGKDYNATINGGKWLVNITNELVDGKHSMTAIIVDNAGNETVITKDIFIDGVPPKGDFTYYKEGQVTKDITRVNNIGQLTFNAKFTDHTPSAGLDLETFTLYEAQPDGSFNWSANGAKAYCNFRREVSYSNAYDISSGKLTNIKFTGCSGDLPEGEYYIIHNVHDKATEKKHPKINQYADVIGLHFVVDHTAPTTQLSFQADLHEQKNVPNNNGWRNLGWYESFDNVNLEIGTGDQTNDFIQYQILDGDVTCPAVGSGYTRVNHHGHNVANDVNGRDGIYSLCYYGEDQAGNVETPTHKEILRVDDTRGITDISSVSGNLVNGVYYQNTDSVDISFTSVDNESGIARVRAYLFDNLDCNGSAIDKSYRDDTVNAPGAVHAYSFNSGHLADGQYCYRVWGYDRAQNWTDFEKVSFVVDTKAPEKLVGLKRENNKGETQDCNAVIKLPTDNPDTRYYPIWDDGKDVNFSHYEYSSFNASDGKKGLKKLVLPDSEFIYTQAYSFNGVQTWPGSHGLPKEGTYGFAVRAVDKAGNKSEWALGGEETLEDSCQITYFKTTDVTVCKEDDSGARLEGWQLKLMREEGGYSGTTNNDGCVTFEEVPVGKYVLGETMQEGWENVSGVGDVTVSAKSNEFIVVNKRLPITVAATKIVCTDEKDLPNMAFKRKLITANTAQEWIATHKSCKIVPEWQFEWTYKGKVPGDTFRGPAGVNWTTFTGNTSVAINKNTSRIKMREVLPEGYLAFTHDNTNSDVTAEFYCANDGTNYDNEDWINNPKPGKKYYCVAWNVPANGIISGQKWNDENQNREKDGSEEGLNNWEIVAGQYEKVGEYSVDPKSATEVNLGVFQDEQYYVLKVDGTYGAGDKITADAECSTRDGSPWRTIVKNYESYGERLLDLEINGEKTEWGTCNPSHTYTKLIKGNGSEIKLLINETYRPNDSGSLSVVVYKLNNAKSTLTADGGNYKFESLMAGEYIVCEMYQENWLQTFPRASESNANVLGGCHMVKVEANSEVKNKDFGNATDNIAPEGTIDAIKYPEEILQHPERYPGKVFIEKDKFVTQYNTPIILGTATDANGVQSVVLSVNGHNYTATLSGNDWEAKVTDVIPDGLYDVKVVVTDIAGNTTEVSHKLRIDTIVPTAVHTYYKDNNKINGFSRYDVNRKRFTDPIVYVNDLERLSFTAKYEDVGPTSGLYWDSYVIFEAQDDGSFRFSHDGKKAFCSWRNDPNLIHMEGIAGSDTDIWEFNTPESFANCHNSNSLPNGNVPDGEYYMTHQVYDTATREDIPSINHFRDWTGLHFIMDTVAPDVEITTPFEGNILKGAVDIRGTVTDETKPDHYWFAIKNSEGVTVNGLGVVNDDTSFTDKLLLNWDTTSVSDGEYTIKLEARDAAGNKDEGSVQWIKVVVDNTAPTVSQLDNQTFLEGQDVPVIDVVGQDNLEIKQLCATLNGPIGTFLPTGTKTGCDSSGGGTEHTWNNAVGFPTIFDTSMIPEGVYTVNYYVVDGVGNRSDANLGMEGDQDNTVIYTLNNVAPEVSFSASDYDITKKDTVSFTGSFIDPSSKDAGDGIYDDQDWTAKIDYGDGEAADLGLFHSPGNIPIPEHKYTEARTFNPTLTVCEASPVNIESDPDNLASGEGVCTVVALDRIKSTKNKSKNNKNKNKNTTPAVVSYYRQPTNNQPPAEEQVDTVNTEGEKVDVAGAKIENETEVKGAKECKAGWPLWLWVVILMLGGIMMYLLGKLKNEKIILLTQALVGGGIFALWYFFDDCRTYQWVPYVDIIGGMAIMSVLYSKRLKQKQVVLEERKRV